ncbi:MAG: hypothetical protein BRC38_08240 [Cyanobacteria bacterium QH_6_48_35]|nr:MAG: hypothetical protein BRC34_09775 [Cyanobacteria bacterium QH_1_48_107]PSO65595.1 MAG: hypothetical protein BRC38_08240 [Cyanobacteria bacterium QH_6_48_35]PSO67815.1 MAG: hypothetical protein BRC42_15075 [Cyanobacteria bacterium QS_1_48_34]PSO76227.1 MAG: hypothetical protein BRC37_03855 [Cyanobacteria bacterium QH_3_48_40]PSO81145.1 MAG: hypothetical protein BRC45_12060 [Cyanobacteria bacterium QS_5_48_63]PSO89643.1 MAG: hypothetical protein BRC46_15440 [Cyanobacteria bacterium QS_6_4
MLAKIQESQQLVASDRCNKYYPILPHDWREEATLVGELGKFVPARLFGGNRGKADFLALLELPLFQEVA